MPTSSSEGRLIRIEKKLDDLSEAFIILARTEEKLATIERDRNENNVKIEKIENRIQQANEKIDDIVKIVNNNSSTNDGIKKIAWLTIAGIIGAVIMKYFT